jgi:uncharacterized protein YecE (DUF72 family)
LIHVGTSGFSYDHWKEAFYPKDVPKRSWLEFYSSRLDCVEINSSFYHLPRATTIASWYERTPNAFRFVLKGSRFITHHKRLNNCREAVALFYERAEGLKEKLDAVLWQVPPQLRLDLDRLEVFLDLLPPSPQPVFEFRDPSWFTESVYDTLHHRAAALCVHDMPGSHCPDLVIGTMLYMRFHGFDKAYGGDYPDDHLHERARWIQSTGARDGYVFFNNDIDGHAVSNAHALRHALASEHPPSRCG